MVSYKHGARPNPPIKYPELGGSACVSAGCSQLKASTSLSLGEYLGSDVVFCKCSNKPSSKVAPKLCYHVYIMFHVSCFSLLGLCQVRGLCTLACRWSGFSLPPTMERRLQPNTACLPRHSNESKSLSSTQRF